LYAGPEVELASGLVSEENRVLRRQRTRDRDALLLTSRELLRIMVEARTEPHSVQHLGCTVFCATLGRHLGTEAHILQGGQLRKQVERLKDKAHSLASVVE
jgi:hypothetical protein